jgi:hypothetical protein
MWLLALVAWSVTVLATYYPRLVDAVLVRVGVVSSAQALSFGSLRLPTGVDATMLGHAAWRMFGTVVLAWVALALGWRILALSRLLRSGGGSGELALAAAVGLGATAYAVGALAVTGVLSRTTVAVLVGVLAAHASVWTLTRGVPTGPLARAQVSAADDGVARWAWPVVVCVCALVALAGALAPEVQYDALWYHLQFPRLALEQGALVDDPLQYVALYPQTAELLYAVGLAWDGAVAAKLVHFLFGGLAALSTYALARLFLTPAYAGLSVAVFVAAPIVGWEATTAYNELAVASFVTLGVRELGVGRERLERATIVRIGILFGFALATKHLALIFFAPALALVAFEGYRRSPRFALARAGLCAGIAFVVAAPWYLRSWSSTGNPVFPELYSLFGAPSDRWTSTADRGLQAFFDGFGMGRGPLDLLALPWNLTVHPEHFGGSLGPLFLVAIPLLAVARRPALGIGTVALFALGVVALWASPISSFQARFLVPLAPVLAVLAAAGLARFAERVRRPMLSGAVYLGVCGLLLLQLPFFVPAHGRQYASGEGWITHALREVDVGAVVDARAADAFTARNVRGYRAIQWANEHLPARAKILTFVGGADYYSARPLVPDIAVVARPATWGSAPGDEARVLATLRKLDVTHVLLDRRSDDLKTIPLAITGTRFRRSALRLVYSDGEAELFAVRADAGR